MKKNILIVFLLITVGCQKFNNEGVANIKKQNILSTQKNLSGVDETSSTSTQSTEIEQSHSQSVAETDSHQVGNGGGGVCIAGTCQTMAEAGLRMAVPGEEYSSLDSNLILEIKKTIDQLPLASYRETLLSSIIGQGNLYKKLEVIDSQKLEMIRKRYAQALLVNNSTIDISQVHIFAFSGIENSRSITYLLPEFFNLTLQQQVKILIHELIIRRTANDNQQEGLNYAFEMDGIIEDLLKDPQVYFAEKFRNDRWELLCAKFFQQYFFEYTTSFKESAVANWFLWLKEVKNIVFEVDKVCEEKRKNVVYWDNNCAFNFNKMSINYYAPVIFLKLFDSDVDLPSFYNGISGVPLDESKLKREEIIDVCKKYLSDKSSSVDLLYPIKQTFPDTQVIYLRCLKDKNEQIDYDYKLPDIYLGNSAK